jgi:hypothetical protein
MAFLGAAVPFLHQGQLALPKAPLNLPAVHCVHVALPEASANVPFEHFWHNADHFPTEDLNCPTAQAVQDPLDDEPQPDKKLPAAQGVQVVQKLLPKLDLYLPAGHTWHLLVRLSLYLPGMQAVLSMQPGLKGIVYLPAGHRVHSPLLVDEQPFLNLPSPHASEHLP